MEDMAVNRSAHHRQKVYDKLFQKFEFTNHGIVVAKHEVESFYDFCRKSSALCPLFEKNNYEDWYKAIEIIKMHAKALDLYTSTITRALKIFVNHSMSAAGNVRDKVNEIEKKTVDIFLSVEIKVRYCMKAIQEIIEKMKVLEGINESQYL